MSPVLNRLEMARSFVIALKSDFGYPASSTFDGHVIMATDILSDVLRQVHLSTALFFDVEGRAPWVTESQPSREFKALIMPTAQPVINYHVVANGLCWATLLGREADPIRLPARTVIVFPQGQRHVLSSEPGLRAPFDPSILEEPHSSLC